MKAVSADVAAEIARDREAEIAMNNLERIANELPPLIDRFYSDPQEWADYNNDAFSEHSAVAKESLRELAEQIHLDPESADYAEFGRYVFQLMDSYMRSV